MSPRSRIRQVVELAGRVEELSSRLRELKVLASRIEASVKPPAFNIEPDLELLCSVAAYRVNMGACEYMDGEGYCSRWCFYNVSASGLDAIKHTGEDEDGAWECYQPHVLTHWLLYLVCPAYTPADDDRRRKLLGDGYFKCVNGKLVLLSLSSG
jgi:hypothetical protein